MVFILVDFDHDRVGAQISAHTDSCHSMSLIPGARVRFVIRAGYVTLLGWVGEVGVIVVARMHVACARRSSH